MRVPGFVAWMLAVAAALPARAVPPIEAYGQLPSVDLIALSPDGRKSRWSSPTSNRGKSRSAALPTSSRLQALGTGAPRSVRCCGRAIITS